jgi:glycosyltransferase involved in cell wall biosynthesis
MPMMRSVSVVMFAFNEEENVAPVVDEAARWLSEHVEDWEIVFVDDGSQDATADRAREVAARWPGSMQVHSYRPNRGIGGALKVGFAGATKRWVTLLPCDGQLPPEGLQNLFDVVEKDASLRLVTCHYPHRFEEADNALRLVLSRGLRVLTWLATGVHRKLDGVYLIRRDELLLLPLRSDSFFLNLELPIRALHARVPAGEATMHIRPRRAGESKVLHTKRIRRVIEDTLRLGVELRTGRA